VQFCSNRADVDLVCAARAIVMRHTNDQPNLSWSREAPPFRPRPKRSIDKTRHNGDVAPGHERADPAFEFLSLASCRSGSFRKNDQDRSWIRKQLAANRETLSHAHLACKRQGVNDHSSDPETRNALEEVIRSRGRKRATQLLQGQRREQAKCVKMTAMIRDDNERAIGAEIFVTDDFETVISA